MTGRFPTVSSKGYSYLAVCYLYDENIILVRTMKNLRAAEHCRVYNEIFTYLDKPGLRPSIHKMENEFSQELQTLIVDDNKNTLQRMPPYDHCNNPAEKAIDKFKYHFVAGLSAIDPRCPLHIWCHLIPQCEAILNMLYPSDNIYTCQYTSIWKGHWTTMLHQ